MRVGRRRAALKRCRPRSTPPLPRRRLGVWQPPLAAGVPWSAAVMSGAPDPTVGGRTLRPPPRPQDGSGPGDATTPARSCAHPPAGAGEVKGGAPPPSRPAAAKRQWIVPVPPLSTVACRRDGTTGTRADRQGPTLPSHDAVPRASIRSRPAHESAVGSGRAMSVADPRTSTAPAAIRSGIATGVDRSGRSMAVVVNPGGRERPRGLLGAHIGAPATDGRPCEGTLGARDRRAGTPHSRSAASLDARSVESVCLRRTDQAEASRRPQSTCRGRQRPG